MGNFPNQCDPSDRDKDLACCWLKQKIVSDFNCVSIPVKHARVLGWHTSLIMITALVTLSLMWQLS